MKRFLFPILLLAGSLRTAMAVPPPPTVQFAQASYTVAESGGSVILTVTRPGSTSGALSVDYATSDGTATADTGTGGDYTPKSGTLSFADKQRNLTIVVPILDDNVFEGSETFTVALSNPSNSGGTAQLGTPSVATVTIVENTVRFASATSSVGEADGSVILTVTRDGETDQEVDVAYATADGTATAGADYTATSGTLVIPAGQSSATITVPILDDTLAEGNETFTVALSAPITGSAVLGTPTTTTVTIIDDEPPPTPTPSPTATATATPSATATPTATPSPSGSPTATPTPAPPAEKVGFSPASYTVAEGSGQVVLTVTRTAPGAHPAAATVHYSTADNTASAGTDYTATAGDLSWPDGDKSAKTITIPIVDDGAADAGEAFTVVLSDAVGTNIQQATATVTIAENVVQFSSATFGAAQSLGTAILTLTRTGEADAAVTLSYATSDGSADPNQTPAVTGTDYTGTATGTVTFDVGETTKQITVPVIDHASYDPVRVFTVTLSAPTGSAVLGSTTAAVVSIGESVLQLDQDSYSVAENGGSVVLNVTRAGDVSQAVTVHYATADGTAVSGTNYTQPSNLTLTFDAGVSSQQITIGILDDGVYTGDQDFRIGLSAPTNSAILTSPSVATVTIKEATPQPTPTPTATPEPTASPTATPTATESPTATPSATTSPSPLPSATATATPTPTPLTNPAQPLNISTRGSVGTGEDVMIGGFIIRGTAPKSVIVRVVGPSLASLGVSGALLDPVLELHNSTTLLATNDNWKDTQQSEIEATGVAPDNEAEPAIVTTLDPGGYTAVVKGKNGFIGVALVEVYDLDASNGSELVNISTRGVVAPDPGVLIGGFIVGGAVGDTSSILVRALGPSLGDAGVADPLPDPTLAIHSENGDTLISDDDWADDATQATEIIATGIPPSKSVEAAAFAAFPPGKYTAVVSGKNGASGVALVEIYHVK